MKTLLTMLITLLTAGLFSVAVMDDAQAKRMGGGKSFGGKSSFSQAAPVKPAPTRQQTAGQQQNTQQRAALTQRGGLMGMLGGLALGGLLGALFFGGAFENINFFDIAVLGLIAFLLYKLFARRRAAQAPQRPAYTYATPNVEHARDADKPFDTDLLFKKPAADPVDRPARTAPASFDAEHFLNGAQAAYRRLQAAWDTGDLADIRQFTTDGVFAEIQEQFHTRRGANHTELLEVNAELLEVGDAGQNTEASVLFDVLMRETDDQDSAPTEPQRVREIWHFTRPARSTQPTWYLDGIQQTGA